MITGALSSVHRRNSAIPNHTNTAMIDIRPVGCISAPDRGALSTPRWRSCLSMVYVTLPARHG